MAVETHPPPRPRRYSSGEVVMQCPLCNGVGGITHSEFKEPKVIVPKKLDRDQRIILQAIHLLTEDRIEINGVNKDNLEDFCIGMDEEQITRERVQEILVELTGLELIQLMSWSMDEHGDWLPTVVCTENGQLVAEKLEGGL